jgi:hypothetical protein
MNQKPEVRNQKSEGSSLTSVGHPSTPILTLSLSGGGNIVKRTKVSALVFLPLEKGEDRRGIDSATV